jgi:hypothetical protein
VDVDIFEVAVVSIVETKSMLMPKNLQKLEIYKSIRYNEKNK